MCPKNTWLKLHRPDLLHQFSLSEFELHLVEQGNEVEAFARNLWPGGVLVAFGGEDGCRETERLMLSRVPAIFQATFVADGFIAKCDVLVPGDGDTWDIYEIKGTNSKKEGSEDRDHIFSRIPHSEIVEDFYGRAIFLIQQHDPSTPSKLYTPIIFEAIRRSGTHSEQDIAQLEPRHS